MTNYLEKNHEIEDVKEVMARFSTDVIGCCAFGIECDSFTNPKSEFRKMGTKALNLPLHKSFSVFAVFLSELIDQSKSECFWKGA